MRDIYVDKQELRLKYNPKESDKLLEFTHPELLLNSGIKFHKYPEGYHNDDGTKISSIVCKLLLTNDAHDGIWLIKEDDKNKISIPGGHLGEAELFSISNGFPYTAIYETIIRELIEENPVLRGTHIDENSNMKSNLEFVLHQYGFDLTRSEFPFFYSYEDFRGSFIIYMIKEVTVPSCVIPPFYHHEFRNMVWYSRKEHSINRKTSRDRRTLFDTDYDGDIRVLDRGISLLDKIFSTENIFGKINIY